MMRALFLRLGFVPIEQVVDAVAEAWAEADRERAARVEAERRFDEEYSASPDGLADRLDDVAARLPATIARHS